MSMALRQPMTLEAFLEWEERQPTRFEFDGVQPRAMTDGSANHARVQRNLIAALALRLQGGPCEPFGSELRILAAGSVRYPDAFVTRMPIQGEATSATEPVVVFEIISPGTSGTDRIVKTRDYGATPSIKRYVVLEQDRLAATVFSRDHDDWVAHVIAGDTELDLPEIGISIPLAELYTRVELASDT